MLVGRGGWAFLLIFGVFVTAGGVGTGRASAASIPKIEARVQALAPEATGTTIRFDGKRVSLLPPLIRVVEQDTASAYSLDAGQSPARSDRWLTTRLDTPGLHGVASAYWIVTKGSTAGRTLANTSFEQAAEQLAIWHFTNKIPLRTKLGVAPPVLERAQNLAALAPHRVNNVGLRAQALYLSGYVAGSNARHVNVNVQVGAQSGFELSSQVIFLVIGGGSACILTGKRTTISQLSALRHKGPTVCQFQHRTNQRYWPQSAFRPIQDPQTAQFQLDRPHDVTDVSVDWIVTSNPGEVFLPTNAGPPLITRSPFKLDLGSNIPIDPAKLPSASALAKRSVEGWLLRLLAWVGIPIFLVLVLLFLFARKSGRDLARRAWKRFR
jgi:hypothetical protein